MKRLLWTVAVLMVTLRLGAQLERTTEFHEKYTLTQVVVLSRHNIRSPISGPDSFLGSITPYKWHVWSSAPGELSLRGGVLETMMGQYFRQWLKGEGLINENFQPAEGTVRFYANSMQRTIATAEYFCRGLLPMANVAIEHHYDVGTMDPVFTPQLNTMSDEYRQRALQQIADLFGDGTMAGIGEKMSENLALIEEVIDLKDTPIYQQGHITGFKTNDTQISLEVNEAPSMSGGLTMGTIVSDALVLQYYEEPDDVRAAFGHKLTTDDWARLSAVKDWYGDVLYTAPLVATNVARPLLKEISAELKKEGRLFSYLCGHDANIGSVLAALGVEDYTLPKSIEAKTPIGGKMVVEKWRGKDGGEYVALNLCYLNVDQLRHASLLSLQHPPMVFPLHLMGLKANSDGLYSLKDFDEHVADCITQNIQEFVSRQMKAYPKSRLLDIYKSCFQDYLGAEHLVSNRKKAKAYLDEELRESDLDNMPAWYYEPCGIDSCYYRVSLRAVKERIIPEEKLLDAFIRSANSENYPSAQSWKKQWLRILNTIDRMNLSLPEYQEDKRFIDSILSIGKYAISHSPEYREAYHPHYRIIARRIFDKEIKPRIDKAVKQASMLQIKNRHITLRQDLTRGGAICFVGRKGEPRNYVNVSDEGRYIQQSYYAGNSIDRKAEGQSAFWSPWPWNPIQVGDYKRNRAQMLECYCWGRSTYVKCIPMLWDMDNRPAEAEMEQWTTLKGNVAHVRCRLTCHRTDSIYNDVSENQQEIPAVYPISSLNHLYAYRGPHPFASEPVDTVEVEELRFGQDEHGWGSYDDINEQWMAFVGDDGWGIGVYSPSATRFLAGRYQPSRSGEAEDDATSYIAPIRMQHMHKQCIVEYEYYLIFGTIDEIRRAVYRLRPKSFDSD